METQAKKKKLTVLLLVTFFILTLLTMGLWAFDNSSTIRNTQTTNVTATSVTVTWTTNDPKIGRVIASSDKDFNFNRVPFIDTEKHYDDRDVSINSDGSYSYDPDKSIERYTHHVTVRDLDPDKEYFFKILNGVDNYDVGPIKTLSLSEDIQTPDPAYGKIVDSAPNDGFVVIRHKNEAEKFSIPLAENGSYTIDMHLFPKDSNAKDLITTVATGEDIYREFIYINSTLRPLDNLTIVQEEEETSALNSSLINDSLARGDCPGRPDLADRNACMAACLANPAFNEAGCQAGCDYECGKAPSGETPTPTTPIPTTPAGGTEGGPCADGSIRCQSGQGKCDYCSCAKQNLCIGRTLTCNQACAQNPTLNPSIPTNGGQSGGGSSSVECLKLDSRTPDLASKLAACGWGGCQGFQNGNKDDNKFFCATGGPTGGGCYTTASSAEGDCKPWGGGSGSSGITQQILATFKGDYATMCQKFNADPNFVNSFAIKGDSKAVQCDYGGVNCAGGWADSSWYSSAVDDVPNDSGAQSYNQQVRNCAQAPVTTGVTLIDLGTNDCTKHIPLDQFEANMNEVIGNTVNGGGVPVILQITPNAYCEEELYNGVLNRLATKYGATVVPTSNYVQVGSDGVHWTGCEGFKQHVLQDVIPQAANNIRDICAGQGTNPPYNVPYQGSNAHKLTKGLSTKAQGPTSELTVNDSGKYAVLSPEGDITKLNIVTNGNSAIVKVFNDENKNNIKDVNESYLQDVSQFDLKKEASILPYTLNAGWNLIHVPMVEDGNSEFSKASELMNSFNNQSAKVIHVARYNGNFEIFTKRENDTSFANDFEIIPGQAIFVYNNTSLTRVNLTGKEFAESVPAKIKNGWNLVGFISPDKEYNSEGILVEAEKQQITATVISKYENGLYDSVVRENNVLYGNNFSILPTQGYFLKVIDAKKDEFKP